MRSLPTAKKSSPRSPQLEKSPLTATKTQHSQNNKMTVRLRKPPGPRACIFLGDMDILLHNQTHSGVIAFNFLLPVLTSAKNLTKPLRNIPQKSGYSQSFFSGHFLNEGKPNPTTKSPCFLPGTTAAQDSCVLVNRWLYDDTCTRDHSACFQALWRIRSRRKWQKLSTESLK